jgi:ATP-dependent Clp protease ATP-binding subunit ClpX
MMKTPEQLDITLQAAILQLGRTLSAEPPVSVSRGRAISPDVLAAEVERVLGMVRQSPARRLFGVRQNLVDGGDAVRLKAVAFVVWQMIGEGVHPCVHETAKAVVDGRGVPCEQILLAREYLGNMACEGLLVVLGECGDRWNGRLVVPKNTYSWMAGGRDSKGDFDPGKIALARLRREGGRDSGRDGNGDEGRSKIPTAKELYEKVRQEVVGLDPQIKVLASRFALHIARADALKAGMDDNTGCQMCVCLVASSGASKSFLASRMCATAGLPYVQFDATTLTASGYIGSDVDDIYKLLVNAAGGDAAAASRGVCFLDEWDKKSARPSSRDSRDVGGEAIQMELLAKLQATTTPFLIGGKRVNDGSRQFIFDGRPTGYILAGVFPGLDDAIGRLAGRKGIGFASESGNRHHIHIQEALKSLGFIDELVNRIGLILRLPDPTIENVMKATAGGILDGFNRVVGSKGIVLYPTAASIKAIGEYSMQSKAFYRGAKAILAEVSSEILFDPKQGTVVIEVADIRRAIERLTSGIVQPVVAENPVGVTEASQDGDLDAQPEQSAGG